MFDDLTEHGWSQHNLFLSPTLTLALAAECLVLHAADVLKQAGIGRGLQPIQLADIRGDRIAWLQAGQSLACDAYLQIMEGLRLLLNQHLFLGLDDYESHFAFYAPGAAYSKHLDRFRDSDRRTISVVIYLNEDWLPEQGGALRLHPAGAPIEDITPLACRMVLFLSADMLHEVLPATRDRMSLAGWFRRRG